MKKLIFFGLISFILAAIWLTPLSFVAPHLAKVTNAITFNEPQGTIWNGTVNHLNVQNHYIGKASWKIDPIKSIKSLAFKSNFKIKSEDIDANGLAGLRFDKNIVIENAQFDLNAEYLNSLQKNAKLSGSFNGFVKNAILKQNEVPMIDGIVNWQNGSLESPIKLAKGDYRAVIKPIDENLDVNLSSKEAPIELNGNIQLKKDWTFDTNVTTKSNNPGLMAMMKFAGKPQTDGSILIQQKGDLKPFIELN